jgi:hypothetical protein
MLGSRIPTYFSRLSLLGLLSLPFAFAGAHRQAKATPQQESTTPKPSTTPEAFPKGKKLYLKDGTYQVIREYQRNGDHVRYYSLERGDWEEIPASMIDWDATTKEAAAEDKAAAALVEKVHKQEEAKRMDNVADIDASLQVGQGVFLPSGEGMFAVEGKSVKLLVQVGSQTKSDKLRTIEQIMSPVPIVPGKRTVVIPGAHATLRLRSATPEFYLREVPPDPDRVSPIVKSSRPGESGPEVELLRAKVVHNSRQLESISSLFGQEISQARDTISVQRWEVAPMVYRFTLSQPLAPGEYVLAEILPDGLNYFVWDFGVDAPSTSSGKN